MLGTAKNSLNLLFLNMQDLGCHWFIVKLWYEAIRDGLFGTNKYMARRILELYDITQEMGK